MEEDTEHLHWESHTMRESQSLRLIRGENVALSGTHTHRVIPCHTMPCHAMPCHAMPCHAMPFHAMP